MCVCACGCACAQVMCVMSFVQHKIKTEEYIFLLFLQLLFLTNLRVYASDGCMKNQKNRLREKRGKII